MRLFAFVATLIPKNPAKPEVNAPTINESATRELEFGFPWFANAKRTATTITKTDSTRYSAFKNAMAPSEISFPMRTIFSVPWSCLFIQVVFQNAKSIANTPEHTVKYKKLFTRYSSR